MRILIAVLLSLGIITTTRAAEPQKAFPIEGIPAGEAEKMQRMGNSWTYAISVFNPEAGQMDVVPKDTMKKLDAFSDRLDFGKDSDRQKFVAEVVKLLGEKRARWGITISDARGRPAYRWPSRRKQ